MLVFLTLAMVGQENEMIDEYLLFTPFQFY